MLFGRIREVPVEKSELLSVDCNGFIHIPHDLKLDLLLGARADHNRSEWPQSV